MGAKDVHLAFEDIRHEGLAGPGWRSSGTKSGAISIKPLTRLPPGAYTDIEVISWRCCKTGVLAFLAATGLAALFWLLTGWLRRREPAR